MAAFKLFFCLNSKQPHLPPSWGQNSKEYVTWNEVDEANLNKD